MLQPIFIKQSELSGNIRKGKFLAFAELTTDEQIAKKIYEATGDLIFKGFLPFSWKPAQVVKMRYDAQVLKAANKLTAQNMAIKNPSVSLAAHDYFLRNAEFIKGLIPENLQLPTLKSLNPLFIAAGLAAAAIIFISIKPYLPQPKRIKK